jgi:dihydrofolate reductase
MKLVVQSFISLDGVMQAPGGPEEDRDGGFAYGGWLAPFWSDEAGAVIGDSTSRMDALLLGRRTYDIFAAFWPNVGDEDDFAARARRVPKFVLSTTLTDPSWADTTVISADVIARVAALKELPGREIQVHGSASMVQRLLGTDGLVDELNILQAPITLGAGKRLFPDGTRARAYEVLERRGIANGVTHLRLAPSGPVSTGSFG